MLAVFIQVRGSQSTLLMDLGSEHPIWVPISVPTTSACSDVYLVSRQPHDEDVYLWSDHYPHEP
jgi:hypothetical protein